MQQAASDEARKQLDAYITQNELAVRQVGQPAARALLCSLSQIATGMAMHSR